VAKESSFIPAPPIQSASPLQAASGPEPEFFEGVRQARRVEPAAETAWSIESGSANGKLADASPLSPTLEPRLPIRADPAARVRSIPAAAPEPASPMSNAGPARQRPARPGIGAADPGAGDLEAIAQAPVVHRGRPEETAAAVPNALSTDPFTPSRPPQGREPPPTEDPFEAVRPPAPAPGGGAVASADSGPIVEVRIGRIEIRADSAEARPRRNGSRRADPIPSLAEYLARRRTG
jgi:hypothetical protein